MIKLVKLAINWIVWNVQKDINYMKVNVLNYVKLGKMKNVLHVVWINAIVATKDIYLIIKWITKFANLVMK